MDEQIFKNIARIHLNYVSYQNVQCHWQTHWIFALGVKIVLILLEVFWANSTNIGQGTKRIEWLACGTYQIFYPRFSNLKQNGHTIRDLYELYEMEPWVIVKRLHRFEVSVWSAVHMSRLFRPQSTLVSAQNRFSHQPAEDGGEWL